MNNPQTPMEAAYQAADKYNNGLSSAHYKSVVDSGIAAFLQWFENEPEGLAEVLHEADYPGHGKRLWPERPESTHELYRYYANACIQHLKSMVG